MFGEVSNTGKDGGEDTDVDDNVVEELARVTEEDCKNGCGKTI